MIALWIYLAGLGIGLVIAGLEAWRARGDKADGWAGLGILTTIFVAVTWPVSIPWLAIKALRDRA